MSLYKNKYRIETVRLANWDYGANAPYFITICAKERQHFFGKIENQEMYLNDTGNIVVKEWLKTPEIRPDMNITLDEFIVMPNHFHGIICIGDNQYNTTPAISKFGIQSKNLASIIRGFKSSVTRQVKFFNPDFSWQERFYDNIIKNENDWHLIRNYIINNPANWQQDKFHS